MNAVCCLPAEKKKEEVCLILTSVVPEREVLEGGPWPDPAHRERARKRVTEPPLASTSSITHHRR
jgi:hypothetical protein